MKIIQKDELLHPGVCTFCNTSENREWFIDTGRSFDYEGTIYVCNRCYEDDFLTVAGATSALDFAVYCQTQENQVRSVIDHYEHELVYQKAFQFFLDMPSDVLITAYNVMNGPPEEDEDDGTGSVSLESDPDTDGDDQGIVDDEPPVDDTPRTNEAPDIPTFDFGI